jgi:hypothetical protein
MALMADVSQKLSKNPSPGGRGEFLDSLLNSASPRPQIAGKIFFEPYTKILKLLNFL